MHILNAPSIIRSLIFKTIDSDMRNPSLFPSEKKKDTALIIQNITAMDQSALINPAECKSRMSDQCGKVNPGISWEFLAPIKYFGNIQVP